MLCKKEEGKFSSQYATLLLALLLATTAAWGQAHAPAARGAARPTSGAAAGSFDGLIASGYAALQDGDLAKAARIARQAKLRANRYEGYLLAGMVAYRNEDLIGAKAELDRALQLAPAQEKPKVQQAQSVLNAHNNFLQHRQAAEEADKAGFSNKAAVEYTAAWDADNSEQETGLRAAIFWTDRSSTPEKAVRILAVLLDQPKSAELLEQARAVRSRLDDKLSPLRVMELEAGDDATAKLLWDITPEIPTSRGQEAEEHYRKLAEMAPSDPTPYLRLAELYSAFYSVRYNSGKIPLRPLAAEDRDRTLESLRNAYSRMRGLTRDAVVSNLARPLLIRLLTDDAFKAFFVDIYGSDISDEVKQNQADTFVRVLRGGEYFIDETVNPEDKKEGNTYFTERCEYNTWDHTITFSCTLYKYDQSPHYVRNSRGKILSFDYFDHHLVSTRNYRGGHLYESYAMRVSLSGPGDSWALNIVHPQKIRGNAPDAAGAGAKGAQNFSTEFFYGREPRSLIKALRAAGVYLVQ